jgi:hypothetical protein
MALLAGRVVPRKPTTSRRPIFRRSAADEVGAGVSVGAGVGEGVGVGGGVGGGLDPGVAVGAGEPLLGAQAATIAARAAASPARNRRRDRNPVSWSVPGSP